MIRMTNLLLLPLALTVCACGQQAPPANGAATAPPPTSHAAAPASAADQDVIDVCALFPRAPLEAALGRVGEVVNLNRTDPNSPLRTEPGYGGCTFNGARDSSARIEIGTAANAQRAGLGTPRNYIESLWSYGESGAVETINGLGMAARLTSSGPRDFVIAAAGEDRYIQIIASGLERESVVALARAGLEMPLAQ